MTERKAPYRARQVKPLALNDPYISGWQLAAQGIPLPAVEYRFAAPARQWRFDYAWIEQHVALEVDGGTWVRGRHSRGGGQQGDMEKGNAAVLLGWRVLHYTPQQMRDCAYMDDLARLLTTAQDRAV